MGRRISLRIAETSVVAFALGWIGLPAVGQETTFLRGDVNSDGHVSIADAHLLLSYLFRKHAPPPCLNAADANDSGAIDVVDCAAIMVVTMLGDSEPLPEPYPEPGPDPTDDPPEMYFGFPRCESYGQGQPLVDPVARVEVADAVCRGGEDGRAAIVLSISSLQGLGGYFTALRIGDGIVAGVRESGEDLIMPSNPAWIVASQHEDLTQVTNVVHATDSTPIPAGVDARRVEPQPETTRSPSRRPNSWTSIRGERSSPRSPRAPCSTC
jgi:hypothetical protein